MKIDNLLIGELESFKLLEIKDSITSLSVDLTTTMVSELKFSVYDKDFNMFNSRYFIAGRRLKFNQDEYEIARFDLNLRPKETSINVYARSHAPERMRWDKGNQRFGNISPSIFAANMASKYGLKIFAEDSPPNGEIRQLNNDNKYESIWDVLNRLAKDLDFLCFEARGVLFFASQKFIVDNISTPIINVLSAPTPPADDSVFYATSLSLSVSEDAKQPYSGSASLLPNVATESLYPGCVIKLSSLTHYSNLKFMITRVTIEAGPEKLVRISFSSADTLEERMCTLNVFAKGSSGDCVKRIQTAVKTIVDGKFGPVTESAVKAYQTFYKLPVTGVVDAATWNVIENPPYPYVKQLFNPAPPPPTSTTIIKTEGTAGGTVNGVYNPSITIPPPGRYLPG